MNEGRFSLTTLLAVAIIVGAGAFAAGRGTNTAPAAQTTITEARSMTPPDHGGEGTPAGHTHAGGLASPRHDLPPGHPPIDPSAPVMGSALDTAAAQETSLSWTTPARWESMPNPSSMRLATYRVPRAAGDAADADVSVSQAGGAVDANIDRWIGQFEGDAAKNAKRTTRKVAGLDVAIVEVEGTYSGGMGMGKNDGPAKDWGLLGAIVATPGMPHFFKITGPARTVRAARPELDALLSTLATR
ncbi:MAG: hypothetical protein BGO98_46400 [Myxococcales bacterium 68-20]|nr:hypothetical protein [Myxococcales bacterium]OJY23024.1 MAG: hypothetical protein BGO98_46400 [Myxococcales bacterium 68-20]